VTLHLSILVTYLAITALVATSERRRFGFLAAFGWPFALVSAFLKGK
jgi:hypothetical protein